MTTLFPARIQRLRKKGWTLPPHTRCVDRSTRFGNPFWIDEWDRSLVMRTADGTVETGGPPCTHDELRAVYEAWLRGQPIPWPKGMRKFGAIPAPPSAEEIAGLRGQNVACWCAPGRWCHGDTLLECANA